MMAKNGRFSGGYYGNIVETAGEPEGSGSSGRIYAEITMSEDSSAQKRKCINLNSGKKDSFGVPEQVLHLAKMSRSERKDVMHRLELQLEQIQILQKKLDIHRIDGVAVSSTIDTLSCSNGLIGCQNENVRQLSVMTVGSGKKMNPLNPKARGMNRGSFGRFESDKRTSPSNTSNIILMKQCETLLKRLMAHQYAWVFNSPVDVVKLNIPDYFTVIKHPMDLGTVKGKLASGAYKSALEFLADVRLTFTNAMTYNPPTNDVYIMADTMSKFFEARWKTIEKKLPVGPMLMKSGPHDDVETTKLMPANKKRKVTPMDHGNAYAPEPIKRKMTEEEKHKLGRELESLLWEMPLNMIEFLKEHSSSEGDSGEDEIEIDIDVLADDTLFTLRKLLDDYLLEKQRNQARGEPCEIEMLNVSGLSNSSLQQGKGNDHADEDVDIGGNEPPVSSYPPVEIDKDIGNKSNKHVESGVSTDSDSSSSSESESDSAKALSPGCESKVLEPLDSGNQSTEKMSHIDHIDKTQSVSGLDPLEHTSQQKCSSVVSDCHQDGDSAPSERQVSPEKLYRAALLKNRFADTILKAREKTLAQGDKGDPEKLQREREELELQKKREKARLQAEAKVAEDARKRAEAEAAAEARRKREFEREAARQALLQMEKTVEINENSRFFEDLEMLRTSHIDHLPSSVDETSPDHSQDGLGSFKFGGINPLEQLGLYMKEDDEEEEADPPSLPDRVNESDIEEGEID